MVPRCYAAVRLLADVHAGRAALAFTHRPAARFGSRVSEVSRFSYMKFLGVLWGLRLRRTEQELALASLSMLPSAITRASASGLHLFGAQYPPHLSPCLRFAVHLTMPSAKTRGRVDR